MTRSPRRRTAALLASAVLAASAGWLLLHQAGSPIVPSCTATAGPLSFTIDPDQAANATTIAAEAHRLGLPAHAVSVGLAAALQESFLRNLDYGDRDSVGLFQQRPSQGWGSRAQLMQPQFAAAAFFRALRRVAGWESLPIYQAAQLVQRSADPAAYATWDSESRTFARGFTGETPAGYTCRYPSVPRSGPATQRLLVAAASAALGPDAFTVGVTPSYGWLVASWLVSRAPTYSVERVSFAGWTWTPAAKGWLPDTRAGRTQVIYALRPPH